MIANISTRGSSESLVGALVVGVLGLAEGRRWNLAAVVYGMAVHFKIFPVIYGTSLLVATTFKPNFSLMRPIRFGLISFTTFMALNVPLYLLYVTLFLVLVERFEF
jgi:phosphatidylinositol glycan class M